MTVRMAEKKDIPDINRLLSQVNLVHHDIRPDLFNVGNKYSDEELAGKLADKTHPIFAAVDESDKLLGYCMTWFEQITGDSIRTDVKTLYIDDLCVDETIRGKHIGAALYEHVKKYAKENGFYNITLHVWEGNDNAAAFYARMGLKPQFTCLEQIL
ncbi:MAG: GNAT family N-acetyltransferase [bacterium LCO1.1]|uniref:GNAT family N-acetyltransferase n=1 Tax=Candidatus Weimeria bifida TaxID=2599074 RepID=A0A6N7IW74_9FIRM|nr:GNAT family N-acetyltransferase [Candidatus Weimeria bifida]